MRCCAARAGSSTTSLPSPAASTRRSSARSSPTPGSRSTRRRRSRHPGSSACSPVPTSPRCHARSPPAIETGTPQYAAAIDTVRYVGEPIAVVVARDRYLAEDAAELVDVDYDPLDAGARPRRGGRDAVHDRTFSYGDVDGAMARGRPRPPPDLPLPALHVHARRVLRRRRRLGRDRRAPDGLGELPGAVHAPRRRRRRARAEGRPAAPADAARLRRLVRDQVVGLRVRRADRPRRPPPRRAGDVDRGPARASRGERRLDRAHDRGRGRLHAPTAGCVALRYDAIEDVGAYVRAPEPATLYRMHGSLSGAYRVANVAVRNRVVLTNTIPSGLNRGFGGPQLYFGLERTMAIAARRLGLDPAELARRNLIAADRRCPTARRRGRCTTPATTRRASTRRSSSPTTTRCATRVDARAPRGGSPGSASPASSSRRSRTWATSRSPRPRTSVP